MNSPNILERCVPAPTVCPSTYKATWLAGRACKRNHPKTSQQPLQLSFQRQSSQTAMRFYPLLFLVILTCLYLTVAQGSYEDCCLKYVKLHRSWTSLRKVVTKYREQKLDGGCNIPAIVFSRSRGKDFCADPKQHWVKRLMNFIDKNDTIGKQRKRTYRG
ncbi:C-C motif chemokine 21a [Sardina pilchardus]|uniref:C-C motif chemokine 21a n=1 Tax=Sardina pilchardus TaxID=27697 RepID=UPI002E147DF4